MIEHKKYLNFHVQELTNQQAYYSALFACNSLIVAHTQILKKD